MGERLRAGRERSLRARGRNKWAVESLRNSVCGCFCVFVLTVIFFFFALKKINLAFYLIFVLDFFCIIYLHLVSLF